MDVDFRVLEEELLRYFGDQDPVFIRTLIKRVKRQSLTRIPLTTSIGLVELDPGAGVLKVQLQCPNCRHRFALQGALRTGQEADDGSPGRPEKEGGEED